MLRIILRTPLADDEEAIGAWLPEAVVAVAGRPREPHEALTLKEFLRSLHPDQCPLVIGRDSGEAIGLAVVAATASGPAMVTFLAIAAPARNRGLGTEAVLALETLRPKRQLIAVVPLANGLAIYFWLRIGYRPLYPRESSASLPTDCVWLTRPPDGAEASGIDS